MISKEELRVWLEDESYRPAGVAGGRVLPSVDRR